MTILVPGTMYRPTDVAVNPLVNSVYVSEEFTHRVSKWDYVPGSFTFTLDAGHVTSITVSDGGTGYTVGDPVDISAPTLVIADPVNAIAEVGAETGGIIDSILITNTGNGYDPGNLPTVTATTGGAGAILIAVVSTPWGSNSDGTSGVGAPIGDGGPTDNSLNRPVGLVFDGNRLIITDTGHNRLRTINHLTGAFIASVGQGGTGIGDFNRPIGLDTNFSQIVVADSLNHRAVRYDNADTPSNPVILPVPTPKNYNRPEGVTFDIPNAFFDVTDTFHGVINRYNTAATIFQDQFGTPGTEGLGLFFPGCGRGILTGEASTPIADTRNNIIKTVSTSTIVNTTGTTEGTAVGQQYFGVSVVAFTDIASYVLLANTFNNRVDVYSNVGVLLTSESSFGSPD